MGQYTEPGHGKSPHAISAVKSFFLVKEPGALNLLMVMLIQGTISSHQQIPSQGDLLNNIGG